MALKAGYKGIKNNLLNKLKAMPFISEIGDGLTLEDGELSATGGGGGTTVVANPEGEATGVLAKLEVGEDIFSIPQITKCYQTDNDTESAIVDGDYVPFFDSSAASGAGAPKKSTWSNFCSKIATKFAEVFNTYLGITSIGSGLTVDASGVLSATGSGSGGWPAISEMTTPAAVSSRVKNLSGGYKQVGKIVYVDVTGEINISMSNTQNIPTMNYWDILTSLPVPVHRTPLEITFLRSSDGRPILNSSYLYKTGEVGSENGTILITGSSNVDYADGDDFYIRGTYEALNSI